MQYWIVRLGELFYVGVLKHSSEEFPGASGIEFSNEESLAFPFLIEGTAKDVADRYGGTIVGRSSDPDAVFDMQLHNEAFSNSESKWKKKYGIT